MYVEVTSKLSQLYIASQHFVFGFHGHDVSDEIRDLIVKYHVGYLLSLTLDNSRSSQLSVVET